MNTGTTEQKSGFFGELGKTLKGLVLEDEPASKTQVNAMPTKPATSTFLSPSTSTFLSPQTPFLPNLILTGNDGATGINKEMVDMVKAKAIERKTPFTALLESSDKLIKVLPDQKVRVQAAMAIVMGEGRTLQQILQAIDVHMSDIDGERLGFLKATEAKQKQDLGDITNQINITNQQVETSKTLSQQYKLKIAELDQETVIANENLVKLNTDLAAKTTEFDTITAQFETAVKIVKNELVDQKSLINSGHHFLINKHI